jgi:hypothetical protein
MTNLNSIFSRLTIVIKHLNFINNRLTFTVDIGDWAFRLVFAKVQWLDGVSSLIPHSNNEHMFLADLENCTLEKTEIVLKKVQVSYSLPDIYIMSDAENSFRSWCFCQIDFDTYNEILLCLKREGVLDPVFYRYTLGRGKGTLRISDKKNRPPQKIVSVLESYPAPIPKKLQKVLYQTGIVKKGITISLGER